MAQGRGCDLALGRHPQFPGLVAELLFPDADVDLGEVVDPGVRGGVGEHPPAAARCGSGPGGCTVAVSRIGRADRSGLDLLGERAGERLVLDERPGHRVQEPADEGGALDEGRAVVDRQHEAAGVQGLLGLRALYFLLSGLLDRFHLLSKGLAIVLGFIGVKLVLQAAHKTISQAVPEIPSLVSLAVITVVLTVTMVLSLRKPAPVASSGDDARPPAQADERG